MKNIHILPTDKPSKGYIIGECIKALSDVKIGQFVKTYYLMFDEEYFQPHNIYITSDEEITGFENNIWVIKGERIFLWQNTMALVSNNKPKKIILTTDDQLISDGVQAIDDEFLEWFVKNPSCEFVEVTYGVLKPFQSEDNGYLIHYPNNEILEEPKQETIEELAKDFYPNEYELMERIAFKRGYTECKERMKAGNG